jgi:hypothetical protein
MTYFFRDINFTRDQIYVCFLIPTIDHNRPSVTVTVTVTANIINKSPLDCTGLLFEHRNRIDGKVPSSTSWLLYSSGSSAIERSPRLWYQIILDLQPASAIIAIAIITTNVVDGFYERSYWRIRINIARAPIARKWGNGGWVHRDYATLEGCRHNTKTNATD